MENMDKGLTALYHNIADIWPKIPQMPQNLSAQAQKIWILMKKLHWASVVRVFHYCKNDPWKKIAFAIALLLDRNCLQ